MKKSRLLWVIPVITALFISCQKEADLQNDTNPGGGSTGGTGNNNKDIIGDYEWAGIAGTATTTVTVDDILGQSRTESVDKYSTTNNRGQIKITADKLSYTGFAYSISSSTHVKLYLGSLLLSEQDIPYAYDVPESDGEDNYVKNSSDSLTFEKLLFVDSNPLQAATLDPKPMGARISWKGDTLVLKVKTTVSGTVNQNGTNANYSSFFDGVMNLKKK
jgi:hypothetical protein